MFVLPILSHLTHVLAIGGTPAACTDAFVEALTGGLGTVINILTALGVAVAVIGIVIGGLMRATAWGAEQRIAMSNKAITCAIIGLVIVLLGVTLGGSIPGWFGQGKCTLPAS
jgi:hypothetical protein